MEPVTTVATAWTIAKTAGEISKKLYEFGKGLKDREAKNQIDEILDKVRELKQSASELEDQNRELKEKLRFRSEDFEFKNPFWFEKSHPDRALCPKCFVDELVAPVSEPIGSTSGTYRRCFHCGEAIWEKRFASSGVLIGGTPAQWP
ncbi:MAG: hypothetical protein ABSE79_04805 [Terriglobia bacterium]|jgi:hypothetical protein